MWSIQINWNGRWVTVDTGYKSRDDAEWATAQWKQRHQCFRDPFRAVQESTVEDADEPYPVVGGIDLGPEHC